MDGLMDARCRIELLGGQRVVQGERVLTRFRTQKAAILLAYLAYHPDRSHPRELLFELLWPEVELEVGRNRLRMTLSFLRRPLEPPGVPAERCRRGRRHNWGQLLRLSVQWLRWRQPDRLLAGA